MNYTYHFKEYRNQIIANNELEAMSFSKDDSREYVISKLEERSNKKRKIANIANTIISEYIEPYEKNVDLLTEEVVKDLEEFSNMLFPDGVQISSVTASDHAIIYRIEKILANYYKKTGNLNKYAYSVNRRSLGHMLLINGHSYGIQESPFRDEAFALARMLNSGKFDEKSRTKVLVTIAREAITSEKHFPVSQFQEIFDTLSSNMSNPPTLYETFNFIFFCSIVMQIFREHNIWAKDHGVKIDVEPARPLLTKIINSLLEQIKLHPELADNSDMYADIKITYFLLGDISLDELLDYLTELQQAALNLESPLHQAQGLGMFNNLYLNILYRFSDKPKEEIVKMSLDRIREVTPKLLQISRQVNNMLFNRYIVEFLNAASLVGSFDDFGEVILDCTVYADKALFIHTAMVKEMSCAIFDYMIDNNPDAFCGVAGKDSDYIKSHKDEMKKLLGECCMFHDIGKFFMLDVVENSMRKLTDDEFGIIKDHPGHFEHIFQVIDNKDERVLCIRDCALTHHLWHDGTNGYPKIAQTKNRPFADILAIADSIDAATDFFGRSYNTGKNIDDLIKEFQAQAGTKYGEDAAFALSVPEVRDKLEYWVTEGRKDIYYRIYAFNKL